jgi:polysaccharide deacetylase 2 family uncharacterized protein YibQ
MAARSSGNKKPAGTRSRSGSGSTAKGGKAAAGKSGKTKKSSTGKTQKADSKAKPKKAGSTKSKASSTKSKTPKKSTSSKKRTSQKTKSKPSLLQRHKSYLLGVSLGLLIGGLGAVAVLYYPLITQWMDRASSPGVAKTESPKSKTIPKPSPSLEYLYEESNELETMVRKLDQALYKGLGAARIPDRNIQFIKVSHKYSRDRHWEHADIEVELPKGVKLKQVVRAVEKELGGRQFDPKPMLITTARNGVLIADIRQDGLNTHTVTLIPTEGDYVMEEEPSSKTKPPADQVKPRQKPRRTKTARQATLPPGPKPKVAIIIDDFGQQLNGAKCFIDLKLPVAVAVLPFLPHTRDVAQKASVAGKIVMVHLPMQPAGWPEVKPGPGALMVGMERPQIQRRVADALGAVPNAKGVNNHMGSRFTEDAEKMGWVLESLKRKGMFYVDSRTSMRSMAYDTARRLGLKAGQRAVFLDNVPQPEAIRMQLMKLVARARQDGEAVGIGHVYPITCQVLKSEYNHLKSKVDFVPITALVK